MKSNRSKNYNMQTKEEIIENMLEVMPFAITEKSINYIKEAMDIWSRQKAFEAAAKGHYDALIDTPNFDHHKVLDESEKYAQHIYGNQYKLEY